MVLLNRPLADYGPMVDAVCVDSHRGAYDLVEHLIKVGHRRIGMIVGGLHSFHRDERLHGYKDALQAHGLEYDENLVRSGRADSVDAGDLTLQLLSLPARPSALFAAGYNGGLAAMTVLRQQGLRVPDDIAFAMFDDVAWGEFVEPPLTLVQNPGAELGRTAMQLLFARLGDRERPPQEVKLAPRLVVRRSCGFGSGVRTAVAGSRSRRPAAALAVP